MIEVHFKEDVLSICNNDKFYYNPMKFSAGEEFIKFNGAHHVDKITWYYEGDHEIMQLALLKSLIKQSFILEIPYVPHARQDRQTSEDQPFSLEVFCEIFTNIFKNYVYELTIVDPHSEITEKYLNKFCLKIIKQHQFAHNFKSQFDFVVAPDKGAAHKTVEWAKRLNVPMFCCDKLRDPKTGHIASYSVPEIDLNDKRVLVVDDICDGGATFGILGKSLRARGVSNLQLFVTHGIFSKGLEPLKDYFMVHTTNSMIHHNKFDSPFLKVYDFRKTEE